MGLSEGKGAGPSLAMVMKNLRRPDAAQIAQIEAYVAKTLCQNAVRTVAEPRLQRQSQPVLLRAVEGARL